MIKLHKSSHYGIDSSHCCIQLYKETSYNNDLIDTIGSLQANFLPVLFFLFIFSAEILYPLPGIGCLYLLVWISTEKICQEVENVKVYLVTFANSNDQGDTLNNVGCINRLVSYYFLQDKRPGLLSDYVRRGHGRYVDEEAERIRGMSIKDFFQHLTKKYKEDVKNERAKKKG